MSDNTMMRGAIAGLRMCGGVLILLGLLAIHVHAQTLAVLASFNGSNGDDPSAVFDAHWQHTLRTTENGGTYGVRRGIQPSRERRDPTVLASFNGSAGQYLWVALTLSGTTLYGTTDQGRSAWGGARSPAFPSAAGLPRCLPRSTAVTGDTP